MAWATQICPAVSWSLPAVFRFASVGSLIHFGCVGRLAKCWLIAIASAFKSNIHISESAESSVTWATKCGDLGLRKGRWNWGVELWAGAGAGAGLGWLGGWGLLELACLFGCSSRGCVDIALQPRVGNCSSHPSSPCLRSFLTPVLPRCILSSCFGCFGMRTGRQGMGRGGRLVGRQGKVGWGNVL